MNNKNKCPQTIKTFEIPELRIDPYDYKLYTKEDFFEYYGRYLEWDIQHPDLIIRRKKINDMIFRYKNALSTENVNHLLDKMIETFLPFTSDWS
tara:strand:+ start:1117 stop:1398 length:282 start_codon:yes stop_codon:yes gene_type:complete